MSNTPVQTEIESLRQSVRRWKTLALSLLAGLVVVIVLGTTMALVHVQKARQQELAARQAELEARQRADEATRK
jgi:uncharacterized membrane-anchored protein YhcB (DUF1043 family)